MLLKEGWCSAPIHYRTFGSGDAEKYPLNENNLSKKQVKELERYLNSYRSEHGIVTRFLVERLLAICVDMMSTDSYEGTPAAILPFAQALTLIMNNAHACEWFEGGETWR